MATPPIMVRVPRELQAEARVLAAQQGQTLSAWLRELIKEALDNPPRWSTMRHMKTDHIQIRLEPELRVAAQARAAQEERSVSAWVRRLIKRELETGAPELGTAAEPAA